MTGSPEQAPVSVIMPCYKRGHHLGEAVSSVVNQTLHQWELNIVNDGSTDETREVATAFAQRDPRVRYVEQRTAEYRQLGTGGWSLPMGNISSFWIPMTSLVQPSSPFKWNYCGATQRQSLRSPMVTTCSVMRATQAS